MIALEQAKTKRLVAVHGWSGVILGVFLYVVVLTGAIAVFATEIGTWSVGGKDSGNPFDRWVSVALANTSKTVPEEYYEEVSIFSNAEGRLVFFYHTHATDPDGNLADKGVLLELNPITHEVLSRREGFRSDLFGHDPAGALDDFIVELHVNLHIPNPWGLYATGILGFVMLAAAISGLLLHRHVIKDLFLSPRRSTRVLTARDRHNLLGSWGLPFAVILAFTGAFLSFALSMGVPLLSATAFGGDRQAMIETLIGDTGASHASKPASLVHLDGVIAQSVKRAGAKVSSVNIQHYGKSDAEITINHPPPEGHFKSVRYLYDGTTGRFLGEKAQLGTGPSFGGDALSLTVALHFGTFAGILSRVIWLVAGLAMAYVVWTGTRLWLERRNEDPLWAKLARTLPTVGYGLPLALAGAGAFFFLTLGAETTRFWTPVGFIVTSLAAIAVGVFIRDQEKLTLLLRTALGVSLILLPLLRVAVSGLGWGAPADGWVVAMLDISLLLIGTYYLKGAWGRLRPTRPPQSAPPQLAQTPAE